MRLNRRVQLARRQYPFVMLAAVLLATTPAMATPLAPHSDYLALGASVAFGCSPLLDFTSAASLVGYPEVLTQALKARWTALMGEVMAA